MRRSDTLIKVISVVLLIAIVCYMGFHVADSFLNPLQTALAVSSRVTSSASVEGYVIRQEQTLSSVGILSPVENGKKVAAGGVVAVSYSSEEALKRADRLLEIETRIAHLENIIAGSSGGSGADSVIALSSAVNHRDMSDLDAVLYDAEYTILGSGDDENDPNTELANLKQEREGLLAQQTGYSYITVDRPGIFGNGVDGFESVSPDDLTDLSPSKLEDLFAEPESSGTAFGKLITDSVWYFAAVMDSEDAANLTVGGKATIEFTKNYTNTLTMTVVSISEEENGKCAVVFSCDASLVDICNVRRLSGEVIFSSQSGIMVSRDAVYTDEDGSAYIFLLMGLQSERVNVEIVCDYNDYYYLVRPAEGEILNEGSEIIVHGKDLFDGKVVK